MGAKILQFPNRRLEPKTVAVFDDTELKPSGPVKTLIISDGVFSMPPQDFPFPSAPAVSPKYMEALKRQQEKNG